MEYNIILMYWHIICVTVLVLCLVDWLFAIDLLLDKINDAFSELGDGTEVMMFICFCAEFISLLLFALYYFFTDVDPLKGASYFFSVIALGAFSITAAFNIIFHGGGAIRQYFKNLKYNRRH